MDTRIATRGTTSLLALLLAATTACGGDEGEKGGETEGGAAAPAAVGGTIIPQPLAYPAFPVDSATILGWVSAGDSVQARQHAWNLWVGLTAMTSQTSNGDTLPVYETWLSRYEVYNPFQPGTGAQALTTRGRPLDRGFHSPVQFHHPGVFSAGRDAAGNERVVAGVKYNNASALHVWAHRYTDSTTLDSLNASFAAGTPIADRNIVPFPDSAIATKPVYWIVNQTGLTIMPYWAGPGATTTDSMPQPSTWTQFVAIDPTNQAAADSVVQVREYGQMYTARVIGLDEFYSFTLTQDEAADIVNTTNQALDTEIANDSIDVMIDGGQSRQGVNAGDYGVLVAMHVSTKEIGNWTWQTFWWTPPFQRDPLANDQPATVLGPFKNFAMQQAYWMTVPNTSPVQNQVTFNPYLETAFADSGTVSNCMSCHRMASWPTNDYHFYGNISPGDSTLFAGVTKLDFLWSVQAGASTAQTGILRRIRSQSRAHPAGQTQPPGASPPATPQGR